MRLPGAFAVAGLLALAACHPAGLRGPEGPVPPGTLPGIRPPVVAPVESEPPVPAEGVLRAPLAWDEVDAILHSTVARDPRLQERVAYWITFWTGRGSGHFGRYLERMGVYEELVRGELEARGLPPSLRYLPIVESGYHHSIVSRAGATGLWQLMHPTARGLGLSVSSLVDERRDPLAATRAALDYLEELHGTFGSWFLALAAYNAGPGRVGRVVSRHAPAGAEDGDELYLRLRPHLPAETREFVPRFFAAAALASDPEAFGFRVPPGIRPLSFEEVVVPDATSLDVVALAAEVDEEEIRTLNPHYLRGFTPPGEVRVLRVPEGRGGLFQANYARIPPEERVSFMEHMVARGETLSVIARRYRVPLRELSDANGNLDPRRLQIGQRLVIPTPGARRGPVQVASVSDAARGNGGVGGPDGEASSGGPTGTTGTARPASHAVVRGDTWGALGRRYGVPAAELARANGRTVRDVIRVGEVLLLP